MSLTSGILDRAMTMMIRRSYSLTGLVDRIQEQYIYNELERLRNA